MQSVSINKRYGSHMQRGCDRQTLHSHIHLQVRGQEELSTRVQTSQQGGALCLLPWLQHGSIKMDLIQLFKNVYFFVKTEKDCLKSLKEENFQGPMLREHVK